MVAIINTHDLLSVLHSLFSRIMRLNLEQRLNNQPTKPAHVSPDLSDRLYSKIESIADSNRNDIATIRSDLHTEQAVRKQAKPSSDVAINEAVDNGLIDHLREQRGRSYTESYLGERLVKSSWDHLFHAMAYAREGDRDKAKLHADIALQAMKEAESYMKSSEFTEFSNAINKALGNKLN